MSTCPECYEDTGCTCRENERIAEMEIQLAEAQNQILTRNGCLDRSRLMLTHICEHMENGNAPLDDTWWFGPAETMCDAIRRVLTTNKQAMKGEQSTEVSK
jgi:hypothetical protein